VQVPRCGLAANTSTGIEKAYGNKNVQLQRDIEIGHVLSVEDLNKHGAEVCLVRGSSGRPINWCSRSNGYQYETGYHNVNEAFYAVPVLPRENDYPGSGVITGEYSPLYYFHRNLPERCWCFRCVERRSVVVGESKSSFINEMLRYGFSLWRNEDLQYLKKVIGLGEPVSVVGTPLESSHCLTAVPSINLS
jgi:hypothetical protein